MVYHVVYDPNGEMFEVPAFKLRYLIVELGWTVWHPDRPKKVFND
jgi:hypothetical protein